MARYPSAEWAPIGWMNSLRHTRKTQLTVHITAGEGDPRTIATWRNGLAGSNFVIFRDGRTVQLSDSACKSAADAGATHTISVECVGLDGPLTNAQVQALIRLARDANRLDGVPLQLAATSSDAGIGWHRLGVDGNFPQGRMGGRLQRSPLGVKTSQARGKACPTDSVINQIYDVILPALRDGSAPEEDDDMPTAEEIAQAVWSAKVGRGANRRTMATVLAGIPTAVAGMTVRRGGKQVPWIQDTADGTTAAQTAKATIAAQSELVRQLATVNGAQIDYDRIDQIVRDAVASGIDVTVSVDVPTNDEVEVTTAPEA